MGALMSFTQKSSWHWLLIVLFICTSVVGCIFKRSIDPTAKEVEALAVQILSEHSVKNEVVQAFKAEGFSISEKANNTFVVYKTSESGNMHYSVKIRQSGSGFSCVEARAMGVGL